MEDDSGFYGSEEEDLVNTTKPQKYPPSFPRGITNGHDLQSTATWTLDFRPQTSSCLQVGSQFLFVAAGSLSGLLQLMWHVGRNRFMIAKKNRSRAMAGGSDQGEASYKAYIPGIKPVTILFWV